MKLNQITLENFGIYKCRSFDFSGAPLVIVYGANEAGKTTALNGIRQAIFGFRQRGIYETSTSTVGEIDATLKNGSKLQFSRRKGRPDKIGGTLDGLQIDDSELAKLLCHLDVASYESLFGFSQEELKLGQESLKNNHVAEALAGGGFGGIQALESLRAELTESLSDLYKPRGKNSKINVRLEQIGQARQKLSDVSVLSTTVEELRRELLTAKTQSRKVQQTKEQLQRTVYESRRRLEALPTFQARKAAMLQLDSISIPEGLDANFVSQWTDFAEQRKTIQSRLDQHSDQLSLAEAELRALQGDDALLQHESTIESLGHQAESIHELRTNLEEWTQQAYEANQLRDRLLARLGLQTISDELTQFQVDGPTRSRMKSLSQELLSRKDEIVQCAAKIEAAEQMIRDWNSEQLDQYVPTDWAELLSSTEQLQKLEHSCQQEAQNLDSLQNASEFAALTDKVQSFVQDEFLIESDWQVPDDSSITESQNRLRELQLKLQSAQEKRQQLEKQIRDHQVTDSEIGDVEHTRILLRKTEDFSRQRDGILAHWLDELSQPLIAASITVEQQKERLEELQQIAVASDQAREDLLQLADQVAQQNQIAAQSAQLQLQLAESKSKASELESDLSRWKDQWTQLWQDVPLKTLDHDLRTWATDYRNWIAWDKKIQACRKSLQRRRSQLKAQRQTLLDVWPTNLRSGFTSEQLLPQLRQWESTSKLKAQHTQRLKTQQAAGQQLRMDLDALQRSQASAREEINAWLKSVPIGLQWPEEQVPQLLDTLEQLQRAVAIAHEKQLSLESGRKKLEQFSQAVAALEQTVNSNAKANLVESKPESVASRWFRELQQLRAEKSQRTKLVETIRNLRERADEAKTQLQELDSKLAAICSAAAESGTTANPIEMRSLMDRIYRAEQLRVEIAEHDAKLSAFFSGDAETEYLSILENSDPMEMEVTVREAESQIAQLESQRKKLHETIGQLNERIDQFASSSKTQKIRQEIQNHRGELVELTEQWIVQRLAKELLSRAVELYGEENEPELLKYSKQYLSVLTGGRYPIIEHDKSSKTEFSVRNEDGVRLTPDQLSTGTREQLYLAIRMAYITQHSLHREPLPVIMDDCFVNFDDARTRSTLEAIQGFDTDIQTIVLSCHTRIPQIMADLAPETPVVDLQNGRTIFAEEFGSASLA